MINIPPIKLSTEIKTSPLPDISKTWKIGQLLSATAERGGNAQSQVLLRLGQYTLEARTPIALKTGDTVQLVVKSLGDTPILSIQSPARTPSVAAEQLKLYIANQQDLKTVLDVMNKASRDSLLPRQIKASLDVFLNSQPRLEQLLRPGQIRHWLNNSGILLESKLHQTPPTGIQQDSKAQLFRLIQLLETSEPGLKISRSTSHDDIEGIVNRYIKGDINLKQLARQLVSLLPPTQQLGLQKLLTEAVRIFPGTLPQAALPANLFQLIIHIQQQPNGQEQLESLLTQLKTLSLLLELKTTVSHALAKIISQQLIPLTRETDMPLLLLFDLLIKDRDDSELIKFKVEQDSSNTEQQKAGWNVTLNFNFKSLGPIQARIHLFEQQIATVFQAEKPATVDIIKQHIEQLQTAYTRAGLDVTNLDVAQGEIHNSRDIPNSVHFLDEKA